MDDQVSQNARVEAADQLAQRHWAEYTAQQQAQALHGLADQLSARQDLANAMATRSEALMLASRLGAGSTGPSPIPWSSMSDAQVADRLRDIALQTRDTSSDFSDHCMDLADQLERNRQRSPYDRDR